MRVEGGDRRYRTGDPPGGPGRVTRPAPASRSGVLARGVMGELFYQIEDPVLIVHDGLIEAANPAAAVLASDDRELVGMPVSTVFCAADTAAVRAMVAAAG